MHGSFSAGDKGAGRRFNFLISMDALCLLPSVYVREKAPSSHSSQPQPDLPKQKGERPSSHDYHELEFLPV
ncbi:UNVERIFIED_CONTAM: hypothetical protein K2H54_044206 [Gekko kuhli]